MTFQHYASLGITFILSFVTMLFFRDYWRVRNLLKPFHNHQAYDEQSAKTLDALLGRENNQELYKLMPYVKLMQDQIIKLSDQKRLYLDQKVWLKKFKTKFIRYISLVIILILALAVTL